MSPPPLTLHEKKIHVAVFLLTKHNLIFHAHLKVFITICGQTLSMSNLYPVQHPG